MFTILIVDDHPLVRQTIRTRLLEFPSVQVCGEAVDGADAIREAVRLRPDCILLDLAMPSMNGMQAAAVLKKLLPQVRIVAFTLHGDVLGKSFASARGFDAIIAKSSGIAKVVECFEALRAPPAASKRTIL